MGGKIGWGGSSGGGGGAGGEGEETYCFDSFFTVKEGHYT